MERKAKKRMIFMTGVFLLLNPVFFTVCALCLPARYEETFLGELKEKCRLLEETEGKRIILTGGSGVAFGYDSAMLEEAFPEYQVVNFGMYAGMGTKVMLDLSENRVRKEDIVILSPEQDAQTLSVYFGGESVWQAADGAFSMLAGIKRENWGQMLGALPGFGADKLRYHLKGTMPEPEGIYRKSSFNGHGDIDTGRPGLCAYNIMPEGYDINTPVRFTEDVRQKEFTDCMNRYALRLEKRGARVWYRFCPVNALAVKEGNISAYYESLQADLDFPIMGNPNHSIMEAAWFYDTNFHLNAAGKTVNTVQCIRDIKAMLGDSAPTVCELPQKPEIPADIKNNAEKNTRILYADTYAGNEAVQVITIPAEISQIEDGAFDGCTRLRAVILENTHPSEIRPGPELLRGTEADIYVKDEALSDYRLNYFWSMYAGRIRPRSSLADQQAGCHALLGTAGCGCLCSPR